MKIIDRIKFFFSHVSDEAIRMPIIAIVACILCPDVISVLGYILGVVTVLLAASHLWRRLLVPYVKLREFADKAKEGRISASIVYASTVLAIVWIFSSVVGLIHLLKIG